MAILNQLISLIFIVAIVHAQVGEITEEEFDRYEGQTEHNLIEYGVNSNISKKMTDLLFEFAKRTEDHCKKQGKAVTDEVNESVGILYRCGKSIIDAQRHDSSESPLDYICRQKPKLMNCLKQFTTTVDVCILDEDKYIVGFVHNFVDTVYTFACSDEGKRIADMLEKQNHPRCFKDDKEHKEYKQCMNRGMIRRTLAAKHLKDIATFNAADCRDFDGIFECMKSHLKKCKDDRVIPMMRTIHTAADGITHCSKGGTVAAEQRSSASSVAISLQSLLLMSALLYSFKH